MNTDSARARAVLNVRALFLRAVLALGLCASLGTEPLAQSTGARNPRLFPPSASPYGKSFAEWGAEYIEWYREHPLAGHPGTSDPTFDVTSGQSGNVWFLAGPFGVNVREVQIPVSKALVFGAFSSFSTLEGLATREEQLLFNSYLMAHLVGLSATLDGRPLVGLDAYRTETTEFEFTSPSPNIFGEVGGTGTCSGVAYCLMIKPMEWGSHVLHYSGAFVFTLEQDGFDEVVPFDQTYFIEVVHE